MSRLQFKHLVMVSLLLAVITLALLPHLRNIVYRSDIIEYFQPDDPRVSAFRTLETAFGFQQSLLILLQSDDKSFLESDKLDQLAHLESALKALPGITRVQSLLGNPVSDATQQTRSARALLHEQGMLDFAAAGQLADTLSSNGFALSRDQHVATLQLFFTDEDAINQLYSTINALLEHHLTQHHFDRIHLLGPVEIKHALHHALLHDGVYLMPLVLVAGLGVLWFFLRSWWLVFSGALSIIVALLITAEIVGWLGLTINQTSGLAFGITFIIALADIIHLLMSYCHQPHTHSNKAAMLNSLRSNGVSLFLTSLTTAIGFLSLNGSSSPVFATFGNIASIGVACAFITAVTVTPVVAIRVAPTHRQHEPDIFLRLVRMIGRFNDGLDTHKAILLYGIAGLLCCGVFLNTFHNDPLDYFETSSPIRQATATSERHFHIHHPISIVIDSRTPDGIFMPAFVAHVTAFQNWLDADQRVAQQSSYLDTLRLLQQHVHEYNAKWANTPADSKTVADLWNLYEMASPDNTPQALGLDAHFRSAMINVGTPRLQSSELIRLEQDIRRWFALNAPELRVNVTGHALLFAGIGKELTWNMFMGGLFSAMVISLLIGLFLGNLKVGIISLIPNLFPAGVIFGVWGMGVGVIDIAAAGTLSISLGIVVDDTIHVLKRYVGYRNRGHSPQWSLQQTFEEVGSALVLTTVVLTLGMLILTLSIFGPNRTTAQLMASIIFIALLFDLIMLPHLLRTLDHWLFRHIPITQEAPALTNG